MAKGAFEPLQVRQGADEGKRVEERAGSVRATTFVLARSAQFRLKPIEVDMVRV